MTGSEIRIRPLGQPGDLGWVVMAHGETYAREFGWNGAIEALAARIVGDYAESAVPGRDAAWVAEVDGRRVGCVFCLGALEEGTAQLRILLVDPSARGRGVGGRLVDECLSFATAAGCRRVRLWTNQPLVAARAVYVARGFRLVEEDAEPHTTFGVPMIGQVYERTLAPSLPAPDVLGHAADGV